MSVFNEIFSCTKGASSFAPRDFWNAREGVALRSWPGELLKVSKVLYDQALLFRGDGTRSTLLQQEQHSLAILVDTAVHVFLVRDEIVLIEKGSIVTQLAYNRATDPGLGCKGAQLVALYSVAWNVAAASSKCLGCLIHLCFILQHKLVFLQGRLVEELLVTPYAPHYLLRTHPAAGHEQILL